MTEQRWDTEADVVVVESTYGNRRHEDTAVALAPTGGTTAAIVSGVSGTAGVAGVIATALASARSASACGR